MVINSSIRLYECVGLFVEICVRLYKCVDLDIYAYVWLSVCCLHVYEPIYMVIWVCGNVCEHLYVIVLYDMIP